MPKAFEKQTEKRVGAIKSLNRSNKLKQIASIFAQNLMNDLIRAKLKEIIELQDIVKKNDLNYNSKRKITYNFSKYLLTTYCFLRDTHVGPLSIEKAVKKQSNFANELKNFDKGTKALDKKSFTNNLGLLFSAKEKVLNIFKSRLFPIKNLDQISTREPTEQGTELEVTTEQTKSTNAAKAKTKHKISSLKLREEFLSKIKNEKKNCK